MLLLSLDPLAPHNLILCLDTSMLGRQFRERNLHFVLVHPSSCHFSLQFTNELAMGMHFLAASNLQLCNTMRRREWTRRRWKTRSVFVDQRNSQERSCTWCRRVWSASQFAAFPQQPQVDLAALLHGLQSHELVVIADRCRHEWSSGATAAVSTEESTNIDVSRTDTSRSMRCGMKRSVQMHVKRRSGVRKDV